MRGSEAFKALGMLAIAGKFRFAVFASSRRAAIYCNDHGFRVAKAREEARLVGSSLRWGKVMVKTRWAINWFALTGLIVPAFAAEFQHPNRAALVVQDIVPNKPNMIYEGLVRWSDTKDIAHGNDIDVTAKIDIVHVGGTIEVSFSADKDTAQPYSIMVHIALPQNGRFDSDVDRIAVLEARSNAQQTGTVLAGTVLPDKNGFSIGLTEGDVNSNNLDLLLNDNWLEIPILFKSGAQGKITFEKGLLGQKEMTALIESLKSP